MSDAYIRGQPITVDVNAFRQKTLEDAIELWEPSPHPHCSNCLSARVHGDPDEPVVRCRDHPEILPAPLMRLIRPRSPRGFRWAESCQEFNPAEDWPKMTGSYRRPHREYPPTADPTVGGEE